MKANLWNRQLIMLIVGNIFEFYNFSLFVMFGEKLSSIFFPNQSGYAYYVLFAIGFVMRPLGSLFFGYIGDVFGRRLSLILSVVISSLPTVVIGLMPSYESFGIFSQVAVLLCRLLQGISINGEYIASAILALEKRNANPMFTSCILTSSNAIGTSLALFASVIPYCKEEQFWRFWFLLGGIGSLLYLWFRFSYIKESEEFIASKSPSKKFSICKWQDSPVCSLFKRHLISVLIMIGIGAFGNAVSYSVVVNLKDFVSVDSVWLKEAVRFAMIVLPIFTYPALGIAFIKSKPENVMIFMASAGIVCAYPAFIMLCSSSQITVAIGGIIIVLLGSSISGPSKAVYKKLFPFDCRCTGIAFGKGITSLLFGGLSPMLNLWLIEKASIKLVAGYMTLCAIISAISLLSVKTINPR